MIDWIIDNLLFHYGWQAVPALVTGYLLIAILIVGLVMVSVYTVWQRFRARKLNQ